MACRSRLNPHYDIAETQQWLGYVPRYSLRQALEELAHYGPEGHLGPLGTGLLPAMITTSYFMDPPSMILHFF